MQLSSRFGYRSNRLLSSTPLSDEQIKQVAPSVFADDKHTSRSDRYTYIPTSDVLAGLRKEGFEPFAVVQSRTRVEGKENFTKHMLRLRHASNISTAGEVPEIILLNSHDGTSSYQMLAGMFRFVCKNGLVCGDIVDDIRIPHKGDIRSNVIEGAYEVIDHFAQVEEKRDEMKALPLLPAESEAFAEAALTLKYDDVAPAPITATQVLRPRRLDDNGSDLWTTFNRVQENLTRGGLLGRSATGRRVRTRAVSGIDTDVKLNRALWTLAERMAQLRTAA